MATITNQPAPVRPANNPVSRWLNRSALLNWEVALYLVILIVAIFTRFYMLGDRAMSHDESLHTRYSWNLYANGDFQHTPLMHGPILFHATAFFYYLFGDNDFTARIYTSLLGVAVVMFPLLFRKWLGRWGAILASFMLLISPLMLYYNRYIRHDTPSIFFALVMTLSIFMYLDGPERQKRRGYWLVLLAASMLGCLGSKEVAFIYIAIFGIFLALYWFVRLAQYFWNIPGRNTFYALMVSILIGGIAALAMYIVLAIVSPQRAIEAAQISGSWFNNVDSSSFILWTVGIIITTLVLLVGTLLWAFRKSRTPIRWVDLLVVVLIATAVCLALIYIEEVSRLPSSETVETAVPVVPGDEDEALIVTNQVLPVVFTWIVAAVVVIAALASWRLGWWRVLHRFPELDLIVIIGTLILPWATPFIIKLTGRSPTDYSPEGIQWAVIALVPMAAMSIVVGLVWNWRRWLTATVVFYALFGFFFTTMFTNMNGLATGVIGSLGYWLEQQGVRRGSQPQYYYLGLIMPFYEFLPVIGSMLAMLSGLGIFWGFRRDRLQAQADNYDAALLADALRDEPVDVPEIEHDEASVGELAVEEVGFEKPKRNQRDLERVMTVDRLRQGSPDWLAKPSFLLFVSWLAILNLVGYTLAGEKMPWLGTHLTLPLILLTGWYFGRMFERIDVERIKQGGWVYLLLFPLLFFTLFQVISPFIFGQGPFGGLEQIQLAQSGQWLAVVAVTGLVLLALYQFVERTGWRHLWQMFAVAGFLFLSVLTFRSAWMASFINYDLANEYLVYAHAAPAVKQVLNQIEDISLRTSDGYGLSFSYDNEVSWPYTWYFRDYTSATFFGSSPSRPVIDNSVAVVVGEANRSAVEPLLEDRFYHFEYIRLWWPMQDYFNMTAQRVTNALDFSPANPQSAQLRRGLFDIWWSRDYDTYGQVVGRDFSLSQWPVSDRMHLYVRKDVAAQIWDLGIGDGVVQDPLQNIEPNVCNENWRLVNAELVFSTQGTAPGLMNRPLGISVDANGLVYVAEEANARVSVFNPDGSFLNILGQEGDTNALSFTRPNSVAVGPDGNLYVADTWNYRVQVIAPDGSLITQWGEPGEFGVTAQEEPVYGLWGPRDVAVDADGRVYVADTGNKRIRVYTATGQFVRDIGEGGSAPGQLDEPAGIALHPDGRVFVADTWNRRISVFAADGSSLYDFPVRAWYEELGNRPYTALDAERGILYVTDPDAGRVLVYDVNGNCLGSFGQSSRENPGPAQFRTVGGITTDASGYVYVVDAGSGRVLKFPPFVQEVVIPGEINQGDAAGDVPLEFTEEIFPPEITPELTPEVGEVTAEVTAETTAETTAESTPEIESAG